MEKTVGAVMFYAENHLQDYDWKILILDNNSADKTGEIGRAFSKESSDRIIFDEVKTAGRGAALRESWGRQKGYDVYAYMDADLATNLKDFKLIVEKVTEGNDIVTGSRYIPGADVERNLKRRLLSLIYNILIRVILRVNFMDAQCGFKAMSKRLVLEVIPKTTDNGWFWDTELMILAGRNGFKILEVPVSWREVRDELRRSKVSPWTEAVRQLGNIYRMWKRLRM